MAAPHLNTGCALALSAALFLAGCEGSTPDTNIQAFQTLDEVAEQRRRELEKIWTDTAISVLQSDRPDLQVSPSANFSIAVSGDGVSDTFDLTPATDQLTAQPERSYSILEQHIASLLPRFDQQRLAAMGWERARPMLRPMLVAGAELADLQRQMGDYPLVEAQGIAADMAWVPAVRWKKGGAVAPITTHVVSAWKVGLEELRSAALDNLRAEVGGDLFDTTSFGGLGRIGQLKPEAEPAVILLPEFLQRVRAAWQSRDDLGLLIASRQNIRFAEAKNTPLLDLIYPQWKSSIDLMEAPLARRPLMLSEQGLTPLQYNPPVRLTPAATQPLHNLPSLPRNPNQPATRPALPQLPTTPYIVR